MIPNVDTHHLTLVVLAVAAFATAAFVLPDAVSAVVASRIFGF